VHVDTVRVMFLYLGRRGALSRFTLDLGRAALAENGISATIAVSRQNEIFDLFQNFGTALFPVDTFRKHHGAVSMAWRLPQIARRLAERIKQDQIQAVVELMPHVWSPLLAPAIRQAGARYVTVMHDGVAHPGDKTSWVKGWTDRALLHADLVFTLSEFTAGQLVAAGKIANDKVASLFHPDLTYGAPMRPRLRVPGQPFRMLFLGRIMPYKGLDVFLDAALLLRSEGLAIEVGVFGEGNLSSTAERLTKLDAQVVNRWLGEAEIGEVLQRFDAVVLSHTEASQSGVAAAAFGSGVPVVTTPLGGLIEQVQDGVTGVIAERAEPVALAAAIRRLATDPALHQTICEQIEATRGQRSMSRFARDIASSLRPVIADANRA
jgi:glycosyltransferase involved in cell wall biosynthesis